jgi:hypothetical protein
MTVEHLDPNSGWTVLRDGGQFSPEEITHLKDCEQCAEWLSMFGKMANNAESIQTVEQPFLVAIDAHLTVERGWALVRDRGTLAPAETAHLHCCKTCNVWLASFLIIARRAGFPISFQIPQLEGEKQAE